MLTHFGSPFSRAASRRFNSSRSALRGRARNNDIEVNEGGVTDYEEIVVDGRPELRSRMTELTGRTSVPQIFIGDTHVGGCDDLHALDARGGLAPLLQAA